MYVELAIAAEREVDRIGGEVILLIRSPLPYSDFQCDSLPTIKLLFCAQSYSHHKA